MYCYLCSFDMRNRKLPLGLLIINVLVRFSEGKRSKNPDIPEPVRVRIGWNFLINWEMTTLYLHSPRVSGSRVLPVLQSYAFSPTGCRFDRMQSTAWGTLLTFRKCDSDSRCYVCNFKTLILTLILTPVLGISVVLVRHCGTVQFWRQTVKSVLLWWLLYQFMLR